MSQKSQDELVKVATQVRVGFLVVIFLAAVSAIFGAFQISRTLKAPFAPKTQGAIAQNQILSEEDQKEELKKIDTDKDGLSDYEETYIYSTSPFIEDSDSDGVPDKTEVDSGENPNCPRGKNCFSSVNASSTSPVSEDAEVPVNPADLLAHSIGGGNNIIDLRKQLELLGIPKALTDPLEDAELEKLYSETLKEVTATGTKPKK